MIKTIYSCNNDQCFEESFDIERDHWLEIGSKENSLFINNFLRNPKVKYIGNYENIHFCSLKCLCDFLTNPIAQ